jgi:type I restriction enzyme M protein
MDAETKSQIKSIWDDFWAGGLSNPLAVMEQITYLLFIKRLDEMQTMEEHKAATLKIPMARRIFPEGYDGRRTKKPGEPGYESDRGRPCDDLRWSRFKLFDAKTMFEVVESHVFPFIREVVARESSVAKHMGDARFGIPTPALLSKVVDKLDKVKMDGRDTKGDIYEYLLGEIATAGRNGQFRTPRHIIKLMVEITKPTPKDTICDPACGTCGFLVAAGEYLRKHHPEIFRDDGLRRHFNNGAFHGFDFDAVMLRIGSMNMILHGIDNPAIVARDALSEDNAGEEGNYSLILANPPFAGALDYEQTAKNLQQIVKTKKTELLFVALFLRLLRTGGRAAVIVPDGVLFGSSTAHKALRRMLVEDNKLEAVIKLPSGVFRPYAGVSTAILVFTKTGIAGKGGTDFVWFYDVQADGLSLDDKRLPLLPEEKLGPVPETALSEEDRNDLPDVLARWGERNGAERERARTAQSFCVAKAEIAKSGGYDLSLNRYKKIEQTAANHDAPADIIQELRRIEEEIADGLAKLEEMVG